MPAPGKAEKRGGRISSVSTRSKPASETRATELSQLGHLPDLRPVGFDGSPFPGILSKEGSIHSHLGREKAYDVRGHLLPRPGKPAFVLQALE